MPSSSLGAHSTSHALHAASASSFVAAPDVSIEALGAADSGVVVRDSGPRDVEAMG